jgi:hypothetical protein
VQADGRLVEDVHHAHQAGADLAGQADALGLAAGEGVGAAVQRQIVQTHVHQELQPGADLLEDLVGDLAAAALQLELGEVARVSSTDPEVTSGRLTLPMKTCLDSSRSRVPWQPGQARTRR